MPTKVTSTPDEIIPEVRETYELLKANAFAKFAAVLEGKSITEFGYAKSPDGKRLTCALHLLRVNDKAKEQFEVYEYLHFHVVNH
jgi:hypothetical protein